MIETLIRINIPINSYFSMLPYGGGVYFAKLTRDYEGYGPYYSQWTSSTINSRRITVGAVGMASSFLSKKTTLNDCINERSSFYWDNAEQVVYINLAFGETEESSFIYIGVMSGYSYYGCSESAYINDIHYEPRLLSVPSFKKEVDKFEVGKMTFDSPSFEISNGDGGLDYLLEEPMPGSEGTAVLFDTEMLEELDWFTGYVSADKSSEEVLELTLNDKREKENKKVPMGTFSVDDYPYIKSSLSGVIIPEGYGPPPRIPAYCVNSEETSPTYYTFKYASDATALSGVFVKIDDVWTGVTSFVVNDNPDIGEFDLPYATASDAGSVYDCYVVATLRAQTNPGDIIIDMNERYNSVNYDSSNYDVTEWASESAKLSDVYLYMDKKKEFFKYIETLQNGSQLWFMYDILGNGTRTLRVNDPNRAESRTIEYYDTKEDIEGDRDFEGYSSTVTVEYAEDFVEDATETIYVDTYQDQVLKKYRFDQDNEFESLLPDETNAQLKADVIAEDQSESRLVLTVPMHGDNLSDLTDKLYDVVTVNTSRPDDTYWESVDSITFDSTAVDSITIVHDAANSITAIMGRHVVSRAGREYHGGVRGQVIGIGYGPESLDYELTVRERPESEVI